MSGTWSNNFGLPSNSMCYTLILGCFDLMHHGKATWLGGLYVLPKSCVSGQYVLSYSPWASENLMTYKAKLTTINTGLFLVSVGLPASSTNLCGFVELIDTCDHVSNKFLIPWGKPAFDNLIHLPPKSNILIANGSANGFHGILQASSLVPWKPGLQALNYVPWRYLIHLDGYLVNGPTIFPVKHVKSTQNFSRVEGGNNSSATKNLLHNQKANGLVQTKRIPAIKIGWDITRASFGFKSCSKFMYGGCSIIVIVHWMNELFNVFLRGFWKCNVIMKALLKEGNHYLNHLTKGTAELKS